MTSGTFFLRMAWRETRAAWLRLMFFFLCVALGVAAALGLPDRVARKALATAMAATARAAPTLIVHRRICRFR